ncbi:substrate-binding domain-containing protein [Arthrobacter dokdonensis]|uniref:substrate-binding domain-containing protein n=1 Tax=Arthrobacter dokdonellae TaxID=2211210 RepID=UPI000DE59FA9|nr:substrate-binding domain-containing protein [Arthrobacter dokdonellae]
MAHLLDAGPVRPAFAGGPFTLQQVEGRYRGAHAAKGVGVTVKIFETLNLKFEPGHQIGELTSGLRPTMRPNAAFAAKDQLALGLLESFTANGLRFPEDIAIVGFDDVDFASQSSIPHTSVRQPRQYIGERPAELRCHEIDNKIDHVHRQVMFTPEIVSRHSSVRS